MNAAAPQHHSKTKLLDSALQVIRAKGYAATTVEDICNEAGVTKGSFFHHFESKNDLALSAIAHWEARAERRLAAAPYHKLSDPFDRLIGYLKFRGAIPTGELPDYLPNYTCFLGTLVQETYATHPDIRAACDRGLSRHIAVLTRDLKAAKKLCAPKAQWNPETVAYFIQSVLQGSFVFAKAKGSPEVVRENLDHLQRYLQSLLHRPPKGKGIKHEHSR